MASCGYAEGYHVPKGPKIGFPCVYVLTKPKTMKKYIGGPSRGEIYGVDPPGHTYRCFGGGGGERPPEHRNPTKSCMWTYDMCESVVEGVMMQK